MATPPHEPTLGGPAPEAYLDVAAEHPVAEGFAVRDKPSANWVVRKIVAARAHAERARAWAEQEVRRAQREEQFFLWRFGCGLQQWAAQQIKGAGGQRKSVSLPAGTLGYRRLPAKLVVVDEATVIAWAKQHCPQAIKIEESVLKAALNEHLEQTGELPEGVRLEPERESFYIK